MKTPKLLKKSRDILSSDKAKQREQAKCLKEIQQKLKKKGKSLKEGIKGEQDAKERKRMEKQLKVMILRWLSPKLGEK